MTERQSWGAFKLFYKGKANAYQLEHLKELHARPFWTEFPDGFARLAPYAWYVEIEAWCAEVARGHKPAA